MDISRGSNSCIMLYMCDDNDGLWMMDDDEIEDSWEKHFSLLVTGALYFFT